MKKPAASRRLRVYDGYRRSAAHGPAPIGAAAPCAGGRHDDRADAQARRHDRTTAHRAAAPIGPAVPAWPAALGDRLEQVGLIDRLDETGWARGRRGIAVPRHERAGDQRHDGERDKIFSHEVLSVMWRDFHPTARDSRRAARAYQQESGVQDAKATQTKAGGNCPPPAFSLAFRRGERPDVCSPYWLTPAARPRGAARPPAPPPVPAPAVAVAAAPAAAIVTVAWANHVTARIPA